MLLSTRTSPFARAKQPSGSGLTRYARKFTPSACAHRTPHPHLAVHTGLHQPSTTIRLKHLRRATQPCCLSLAPTSHTFPTPSAHPPCTFLPAARAAGVPAALWRRRPRLPAVMRGVVQQPVALRTRCARGAGQAGGAGILAGQAQGFFWISWPLAVAFGLFCSNTHSEGLPELAVQLVGMWVIFKALLYFNSHFERGRQPCMLLQHVCKPVTADLVALASFCAPLS